MTTPSPDREEQEIEVFYDGGCPLCRREIAMLKRRDRGDRLKLVDIDNPTFRAEEVGKSRDELMARLHARLPSGEWIDGVEVFRRMYAAAGFGTLVRLSRAPLISPLLDVCYHIFARNRLRLTGRGCVSGSCDVANER